MNRIALLACPNGFGHTRRLLCLSEQLIMEGYDVTLFSSLSAFTELQRSLSIKRLPKFVDFNLPGFSDYWHSSEIYLPSIFPDLSSYNFVVSDNLLDILQVRNDAIILASFFWHKTFTSTPTSKHDYYESLLDFFRPQVFASSIFSLPYIQSYPNTIFEKLYKPPFLKSVVTSPKTCILISTGRGGKVRNSVRNFLGQNTCWSNSLLPFTIFLEPTLMHANMQSNVYPANFDSAMYSYCKIALIRPGVGSITDCLLHHVFPIFFYESSNLEMNYNASSLDKLQLGIDMKCFPDSYSKCLEVMYDQYLYNRFVARLSSLDVFGSSLIPSYLNL